MIRYRGHLKRQKFRLIHMQRLLISIGLAYLFPPPLKADFNITYGIIKIAANIFIISVSPHICIFL